MKKLLNYTTYNENHRKVNEGIRDMMTPKTDDDIKRMLNDLPIDKVFNMCDVQGLKIRDYLSDDEIKQKLNDIPIDDAFSICSKYRLRIKNYFSDDDIKQGLNNLPLDMGFNLCSMSNIEITDYISDADIMWKIEGVSIEKIYAICRITKREITDYLTRDEIKRRLDELPMDKVFDLCKTVGPKITDYLNDIKKNLCEIKLTYSKHKLNDYLDRAARNGNIKRAKYWLALGASADCDLLDYLYNNKDYHTYDEMFSLLNSHCSKPNMSDLFESIRDKMTPKSGEELEDAKLKIIEYINHIVELNGGRIEIEELAYGSSAIVYKTEKAKEHIGYQGQNIVHTVDVFHIDEAEILYEEDWKAIPKTYFVKYIDMSPEILMGIKNLFEEQVNTEGML